MFFFFLTAVGIADLVSAPAALGPAGELAQWFVHNHRIVREIFDFEKGHFRRIDDGHGPTIHVGKIASENRQFDVLSDLEFLVVLVVAARARARVQAGLGLADNCRAIRIVRAARLSVGI